jgi:GTP-binding protein
MDGTPSGGREDQRIIVPVPEPVKPRRIGVMPSLRPPPARAGGPCEAMPMAVPNPLARAQYLLAAHNFRQLPPDGGFEVAIAGRSNPGKSSALNALCQQNALARVSKTPGRTQQLVFFDIPPTTDRFLVDLPGYGYAKVPQDLQAHWQAFLDGYFGSRQALRGLVVVMDIRHPLKEYDRQMLGYAVERGLPAHALLTKADKLSRGAQGNALLAVRRELSSAFGDTVSVQTFSGESKLGVDEARAVVARWLEL